MAMLDWSTPPLYEMYFPGERPPGPDRLTELFGPVQVTPREGAWVARIEGLAGCVAEVMCPPEPAKDNRPVVDAAWGLSKEERDRIGAARAHLVVRVHPGEGPVLSTRKRSLGALGELMRLGAVGAVDLASSRVWSAPAIEDELMTDADLDVESLYCIHCVRGDDGEPRWIHTHGLGELGGFDVDLLAPSEGTCHAASTLIRALAYAIIEELIVVDEPSFELARPGGVVRMVPAAEFDARAEPRYAALRDLRDAGHTENRAVLCEPARKGFSLFRRGPARPDPSRFVRTFDGGSVAVNFSSSASERMANRARQTLPVLRGLLEEFGSLELPVLAKVACPADSGGKEHMWFSVHGVGEETLDGTLLNQPFDIAGMNQGDRGNQPIERLSDWMLQSPVGTITPNHFAPIRVLRDRREDIERIMREEN